MSEKIINIEIPVCNRSNVFHTCLLESLQYLRPISKYVDISILYNGKNIDKNFVEQSNKTIRNLGFELYYQILEVPVEDVQNISIVQLREMTHSINPNFRPLILQLDDDIKITSFIYADQLLAAARFMLENEKVGFVSLQNQQKFTNEQIKSDIFPLQEKDRTYTAGGLLLKNISDWNGSLYPEDARNLEGCWSDVLVTFVRAREGLGAFVAITNEYEHYEIRKQTGRSSGFIAHHWGKYMSYQENSVKWLTSQGVGRSGAFPKSVLDKTWVGEKNYLFNNFLTKKQIDLSIEIPSCNRNNALFKYLLPSLQYLTELKDRSVICINYNGGITDEEISKANNIIQSLGFDLYWAKNTYSFEKGKVPTVQFREDAHTLYPNAKYCLILDDDIEFVSKNYAKQLINTIEKMNKDLSIGGICFTKNNRFENFPEETFIKLPPRKHAWMDGGVLLRNITEWNGLFPSELRKLVGTGEDRLCLTVRVQQGLSIYNYYSNQIKHWEHHDKNFVPGKNVYGWDNTENIPNSILYYYKNTLNYEGRWVYDKKKRILNIELPVCDKKTFYSRLFPSLRYLKPISKYCNFVINYQKTFEEKDMKMINKYLTNLGFEVFSTFSTYDFDKTNHSIMKIRNDTHMLKPDTPFILSIDSDMKILNKNYCKDILGMLYWMLKNDNIGTIGLENDFYHWPSVLAHLNPNKTNYIVPTNMYEHIFATGQGLMLRNIKEWNNYLVPGFLVNRIGRHQDTIVVFERCALDLDCCCIQTENASTILDSKGNRGKFLYGWEDTCKDLNSIDTYFLPYRLEEKSDRFKLECFSEYIQQSPNNTKLIFDFDKYTLEELDNMIEKELEFKC